MNATCFSTNWSIEQPGFNLICTFTSPIITASYHRLSPIYTRTTPVHTRTTLTATPRASSFEHKRGKLFITDSPVPV